MLALGVMDLRVMAVVGAAITVERFAPNGARAARVIGVVVAAAGVSLIALAVRLGG
jgi:predicted metal-binding membrane protein